ncbi:MAG: hypothetical protein NTY30_01965 [Candidatus Berkelbacteria bacterium]|nr:hypothetical protein [Candidatus Berkelbacteria bacterium]
MKFQTKQKIKKGFATAIDVLIEASRLLDEGLYFISMEKLKRETYYQQGDPRRYRNQIYGLERSGYIKINHKKQSIEFTTKGRIKILENSTDKTTDGKWRFLSWDIPEDLSIKRRQFCRSIRRVGYKQVQKSLWASPFIKADEIYLIIDELSIRKYVSFIVAERTDIENHLKNLFKSELSR